MKWLSYKKILFILLLLIILVVGISIYCIWLGKGIMNEAMAIGSYHKQEVISYYQENDSCPEQKTDSYSKFIEYVYLEKSENEHICLIRIKIRKETTLIGNKLLFLSAQFNDKSQDPKWSCSTNTLKLYLPNSCD